MGPYLFLTIGLIAFVVVGLFVVGEYISRDFDK